jgi:hypothetical protein
MATVGPTKARPEKSENWVRRRNLEVLMHIRVHLLECNATYEGYPEIEDTTRVREREITAVKVAHSPDLTPSDSHLFLHLQKHLASQKFHKDKEMKNEVTTHLHAQAEESYNIKIQKLVLRLNSCLDKGGDYAEN